MAEWIKVEHTTPDKPEIVLVASMLDLDTDAVLGKCIRIWIWADQQSVDGHGLTVTFAFLDRVAGCAHFAESLMKAGWLKGKSGEITISNFDRHSGKSAKDRALARRRQGRSRSRKRHAPGVTSSPSPSPSPSPSSSSSSSKRGSKGRGHRSSPAQIEAIYGAYPRKIGKAAATKAIRKSLAVVASRGGPDPTGWLKARVEAYAASPAGQAGKFTPYPATWFNQGRYDDDESEWSREGRE